MTWCASVPESMAQARSDCGPDVPQLTHETITSSSEPTLGLRGGNPPPFRGSSITVSEVGRSDTNVGGTTMTNNRAVWPDLVFACLLMLAGLLMLRYGVWHLVNHHEVLSPLLAGGGAVVLGAFSLRQVLRSTSPHRSGHKRKPRSSRIHWWFCAIPVICTNFGSAQAATDTTSARVAFPDALGHGAQTTGSNKKTVEQRRVGPSVVLGKSSSCRECKRGIGSRS